MRLNKTIKLFCNFFLGPLLFVWLLYTIYTQVLLQPHLQQTWQQIKTGVASRKIGLLIAVVLLMGANWSVEAAKWKVLLAAVRPVTFRQSFRAVLSGLSLSVSMPNRMGEYAGRMLHLPEGSRLKAVPVSIAGSASQLLVTLFAGSLALTILKTDLLQARLLSTTSYSVLFWGTVSVTLLLTVFYFNIRFVNALLKRWLQRSSYAFMLQPLHCFDASLLLRLLSLSTIRYIIFSIQYVLLFSFFEVHVAPVLIWSATAVLFLVMALIPTIALAELGLRGKISLQLVGLFTQNSLGVVLTSATAWAINLMLPALAGSVLLLTLKVFKRKHEMV